jgi:hypothetical protein
MSPTEPTRLPTLTEVVAATACEAPAPHDAGAHDALAQRVLAAVAQRVDIALDHRLRETLGPALARLSDALIGEMRVELTQALRSLVAEAVEQELARSRPHDG